MTYNFIKVQQDGHCYTLTLARPAKRNAFTPTMVNEIAHAFEAANADQAVKVVVIKAEGPVFCAGMDLKTFRDESLDTPNEAITNRDISLGQVFDNLQKPTIAVVEGDVIAGAFLIILGCTYIFARQSTRFRLPELELGIFPFQVMESLLKVMPEKKVLQMCLETDYFDMAKAQQMGIVDADLADVDLETMIANFARFDTRAMQTGIRALRELPSVSKEERFAYLKARLEELRNN